MEQGLNQIQNEILKAIEHQSGKALCTEAIIAKRIRDIANIEGTIVTTEKDAVKLALLNKNNIYALKLKTFLDVESLLNT